MLLVKRSVGDRVKELGEPRYKSIANLHLSFNLAFKPFSSRRGIIMSWGTLHHWLLIAGGERDAMHGSLAS